MEKDGDLIKKEIFSERDMAAFKIQQYFRLHQLNKIIKNKKNVKQKTKGKRVRIYSVSVSEDPHLNQNMYETKTLLYMQKVEYKEYDLVY